MIIFLLLFTACCAMDKSRESLDLSRSSYNIGHPQGAGHTPPPRKRSLRRFICCVCKQKLKEDVLATIACGHPCCIACFELGGTVRCGTCNKYIHIVDDWDESSDNPGDDT